MLSYRWSICKVAHGFFGVDWKRMSVIETNIHCKTVLVVHPLLKRFGAIFALEKVVSLGLHSSSDSLLGAV